MEVSGTDLLKGEYVVYTVTGNKEQPTYSKTSESKLDWALLA